ncbi:hypothetical protein Peur_057722 [Populus x canadensis]
MEDDTGVKTSIVIGLRENRAKEVGMAGFDLRSASLHLSQYSETSSSYQNTKSLLQFYDPVVVVVPPNKFAPDGMVGISELVLMACVCFGDTKVGAVLVKNLAAKEPSAHGLAAYYKQYYPCLSAAAATIKCSVFFIFFIHYSASKRKFQPQHTRDRSRERSHRHQPPIFGFYALSLSLFFSLWGPFFLL